ncbi:hypothetical protein IFM89_009932 [Coptis chinensis]|uniref:Uncharacterized protein n=1 Tax=Coptis chinensis TaxID=261450 RepID=A0A835HM04_9MAGN|nr:hypothetical protein IFM89_009932 [Coptis chinensis]
MESQKTQKEVEKAQLHLRTKLCNRTSIFSSSPDSNFSKLKFIVSNSVTEGCNNSVLLLGPRGCGQIEVLDLVLGDLKAEYPDIISVVRLDGVLHYDDNCSLKVWSSLKEMYSQENNLSRIYDLFESLFKTKTGDQPIDEYYSTMKGLWEELLLYQPFTFNLEKQREQREHFRVAFVAAWG